eukprot:TRINITY_DN14827_c0_g1_i1.p1 TRINITY_DN14827_c0_g1~~TRINITY_DN14827_c0_g1_i1.p1  ORF type:complete len:227 (+),score=49.50 TRINITY_DN14827_c0_g1_i1:64-744(+)
MCIRDRVSTQSTWDKKEGSFTPVIGECTYDKEFSSETVAKLWEHATRLDLDGDYITEFLKFAEMDQGVVSTTDKGRSRINELVQMRVGTRRGNWVIKKIREDKDKSNAMDTACNVMESIADDLNERKLIDRLRSELRNQTHNNAQLLGARRLQQMVNGGSNRGGGGGGAAMSNGRSNNPRGMGSQGSKGNGAAIVEDEEDDDYQEEMLDEDEDFDAGLKKRMRTRD